MNKKNLLLVLIVLFSILGGLLLGNLLARRALLNENILSLKNTFLNRNAGNKVSDLLSIIDEQYVDSVDVNEMTEELMIDLVSKLDPHSTYIPAADLADVNSELEGSFSGIGIQFNIQNDTIMVVAVISGGPSEKVGMLAGDRIVEVNDTAFVGKEVNNEKVMRKLRGQSGTKVRIGVRRSGTAEILRYDITRGAIPIHSVAASYIIKPGVGFIRVDKFAQNTYSEFLHAIADLRSKGATKYIVDLRENSGGLMDQAINMVNEFMPKGSLIVYSEGKAYPRYEALADGRGSCVNTPLVVLIDDFSASASEIFAGAIQDNDRGLVVGRRSFGKGLVQQQLPLRDGSAIRLTVARYYTPSGRSIQKPYERGKSEDYERDLLNRYLNGEFFNADSIHLKKDSTLIYKTVKGRTVYGGGGIMPDVFVPRDTTKYTNYLTKVVNGGFLYQFAFQYTDQHRERLNKFKSWQELEKYLDHQALLSEFTVFAVSKGIASKPSEIAISKSIIENSLTAYIIRNVLGDEGFYPVFYKDDNVVLRAVEEIGKM